MFGNTRRSRGIKEEEAIKLGLEEKATEFAHKGAELYGRT
jgi:hypothetical protein